MSLITIITPHNTYYVNDQDQFYYTTRDVYVVQPTDDWRLLGAVEFGRGYCGGKVVRRYTVADIRAGKVPWKFHNGKQRCHIVDFDHGSRRVWMSPDHQVWRRI